MPVPINRREVSSGFLTRTRIASVVVLALLGTACSSDLTQSEAYQALESELESVVGELVEIVSFDEVSLTEVEWMIFLDDPGWGPSVHSITTIVEVRPLTEEAVQDLFGSLAWEAENTVVDLCNVEVREVGNGYVHIGDGYQTIEGCGEDPMAMQDAFDAFGSPDYACVGVVTTSFRQHKYCAPLPQRSEADLRFGGLQTQPDQ